ncbi:MAG: hypothetical protein JXB85_04180 [Anaerolineales bacterium]|nr:hypothetical protein [Anaerolineales bacterium]
MRLFEFLIALLLAVYLLWPLASGRGRSRAVNTLPLLGIPTLLLHLLIEGYRWQMLPLYALVTLNCLASMLTLRKPAGGSFRRLSWSGAGLALALLVLVTATALATLLPVPTTGPATGPFHVGTQTLVLVDESRRELYSGNPEEPRRIMVQIWYPADPASGDERAPWIASAEIYAPTFADYLDLPSFFLDHIALIKTPAYQDARLVVPEGGASVILFSHGWNGFAAQSSSQSIALASHGYVVVAVQHTYGAMVTVFPDGAVAYNNPDGLPFDVPEAEYLAAARRLVDQWRGDIAFTLDTLSAANQDPASHFYQALDLTRIGVYGHSTGGGAALQFCATDSRCQAVLGLDPYVIPVGQEVLEEGMRQPAFFIFSPAFSSDENTARFEQMAAHMPDLLAVTTLTGTLHRDFSDLPMISPIAPQLGMSGSLNGARRTEIIDIYLLAFFELALNDRPTELFDGPSPDFPELRFER